MTRRREFMIQVSAGSAALLAGGFAMANTMVAESDPQAAALGYKADTTKVDAKKFPTHKAMRYMLPFSDVDAILGYFKKYAEKKAQA